jgi:hypothetical protein
MVQTVYTQEFCTRNTKGIHPAHHRTNASHIKFRPSDYYILFRRSPRKTRRGYLATELGLVRIFSVDYGEEVEAGAWRVQDKTCRFCRGRAEGDGGGRAC